MCEGSHPERQELELPCNFIIKTRADVVFENVGVLEAFLCISAFSPGEGFSLKSVTGGEHRSLPGCQPGKRPISCGHTHHRPTHLYVVLTRELKNTTVQMVKP